MKASKKAAAGILPIPEGYNTITSYLTVRGGEKAIEFYKKAFGAEEIGRLHAPDGKTIVHAELKIGDSRLFLGDEFPAVVDKGNRLRNDRADGCRRSEGLRDGCARRSEPFGA